MASISSSSAFLLWLQFTYSVWQFVRVAKFFRLPSALLYHAWHWATSKDYPGGAPFSEQWIFLIIPGVKWTFPARSFSHYLQPQDNRLNRGHYLMPRHGHSYIVSDMDVANVNILDRHEMDQRPLGLHMFLCSHADLIVPNMYVADVYGWGEGIDKFLSDGASCVGYAARVLLTSSREHFLNQNFLRLLSILPLMLQAKGFDRLSIYASCFIIVLDQLSYPANLAWKAFVDLNVNGAKWCISKIRNTEWRVFVSTFMATVSPRLAFSDQVLRNFYMVRAGEPVLIFGTGSADFFVKDSFEDVEDPAAEELNPFQELSDEDFRRLQEFETKSGKTFGISVGCEYVEHVVAGSRIMTFFMHDAEEPEFGSFLNFIDFEHLHFGSFDGDVTTRDNIRKALKWIEQRGRMPVRCNHRGHLRAVAFNDFVDKVGAGYGVLRARLKTARWV